jgi:2,5-dihydroxypyridine 5,6-dioxygenase
VGKTFNPDVATTLAGARNCIRGYCAVQPDERVLLWTDGSDKVEPAVISALTAAIQETGASLSILTTRPPIFRLGEHLSPVEEAAITRSNVVIHAFDLENAASVDNADIYRCMYEHNVRFTAVITNTAQLLSSDWARFPAELHYLMWIKSARMLCETEGHLTDDLGTDLRMKFFPWPAGDPFSSSWARVEKSQVRRPAGTWEFFPVGTVPVCPKTVEGTLVFEHLEGFAGYLSEPIRLTVRNHRVTKVEGGAEARWFADLMKRYPNGDYFCEFAWGINPRSPLREGLAPKAPDTLLFRRAGSYHCGVGLWPGMGVPSPLHWDGGGLKATFRLGKQTVIARGYLTLLEDPEVRAVAAKYGDPDQFLTYESATPGAMDQPIGSPGTNNAKGEAI